MQIWLCKYGETIPILESDRKYRVGMIAENFLESGYDVKWWASDFDHGTKKKINLPKYTYKGIQLMKISGRPYKKNVSLQRIVHNKEIGADFEKKMNEAESLPDLIYVSMPTIDMAKRVRKFAVQNNIPYVLDIRDLWPDVFKDLIPFGFLKRDIFFKTMNAELKKILEDASLVIAPTEAFLNWAEEKLGRPITNKLVVPFGYSKYEGATNQLNQTRTNDQLVITFAGTVSVNFDLYTILEAAKELENENVLFNIVGTGDTLDSLVAKYGHLKNVSFKGWCNAEQLNEILSNSHLGIAPYVSTKNFLFNIPNKPYEYMSYGLPILTCLEGPTLHLIQQDDLGSYYEPNNKEQLVKLIKKYQLDKQFYNRQSDNCIRIFDENFDSKIVYKNFIRYLEKQIL